MANLSKGKTFVVLHQTSGQETPSSTNKTESFADNPKISSVSAMLSNSSYFSVDGSLMSREVDSWIHGCDYRASGINASPMRRPMAQRPAAVANQTSQYTTRFYHALAMVVPMLLARRRTRWLRSPSNILAAFESVFSYLGAAYNKIYAQLQRLYSERAVQDLLSTAWDLIVIIYTVGFLVISVYESTVAE